MTSPSLSESGLLESPPRSLRLSCTGSTGVRTLQTSTNHNTDSLITFPGGFLAGKHVVPNAWMSEAFGSRGYHIVSVAYRFSPQCGMEDQLSDCADALKWCLSHLPSILAASNIDINRYVIAGDSAGGTIATQCAHLFDLKPKAVIDVYGAVSMTDPWYHVVRRDGLNVNKTEYLEAREDAEMQKAIEDRNPANAEVMSPWDWELEPKMSVTQLQSFVCPTTCQQRKIFSGWI